MQKTTLVEYRFSKSFWMKKVLFLASCCLLVWLAWWLWNWDPSAIEGQGVEGTVNLDTGSDSSLSSESTDGSIAPGDESDLSADAEFASGTVAGEQSDLSEEVVE